jgi:hypothetical protein
MDIIQKNKGVHSFIKPPVLLGFDDGFRNVITQALPILNEYKVHALFFVIGEIMNNPDIIPWYVEIKHLLRRTNEKTIIFEDVSVDMSSKLSRSKLERLFYLSMRGCKVEADRQKLLTYFARSLNVDRPTNALVIDDDLRFISKEELSHLDSASWLTVASHAMTHRLLATLSQQEQSYELEQSHLLLREHCPSYYPVISYPNNSFNNVTIDIVKRIYKFAFAGFLCSSYRNKYTYPRIGLNNCTSHELAYIISPLRIKLLLPLKRILHNIGLRKVD